MLDTVTVCKLEVPIRATGAEPVETLSTGATPRPLRRMVPLCSVFAPRFAALRPIKSVAVPVMVGAKLYVAKTCALVVPSDTGPPENGAAAAKISPEVIVSRTTTLNSSLDVEQTSVSAKSTSLGAVNNCADASGESVAIAARADAAVSQDLLFLLPSSTLGFRGD